MTTIDTNGLVALIRAVEMPCSCEQGQPGDECGENPIFRWWRSILVDDDEMRTGEFAPGARRSA